jgi:WD40-like Beta Propeller Repeat
VKDDLARIEIPGEHEARERTWATVQAAFAARQPVLRRARLLRPALALAVALGVVAAVVSPPGRAVLDEIRDAVATEARAPLFRLPAAGKLLVVSEQNGGVWVVNEDGSRRRLGDYENATWSPFGRYVIVTRRSLLRALTPEGEERWSIGGRNLSQAAWSGTETDTRIAYVSDVRGGGVRVVAGDGTGDRLLAPGADGPLAWRPGSAHELAYISGKKLELRNADTGRVVWTARGVTPRFTRGLSWSSDGTRLAVVAGRSIAVVDERGRIVGRLELPADEIVAAAFAPQGHELAVHIRSTKGGFLAWRSTIRLLDVDRMGRGRNVFQGQGDFGELAWSPDGRWLLTTWRTADQWLFVERATGRVVAVPDVTMRFPRPDGGRPLLFVSDRWCCGPGS